MRPLRALLAVASLAACGRTDIYDLAPVVRPDGGQPDAGRRDAGQPDAGCVEGSPCGAGNCLTTPVCRRGRCVEEPVTEGAVCGVEEPCRPLGRCLSGACFQ